MYVKLKKVNEDARLPEKAHKKDFCYDVWAVSEEEIAPNVWRYGLGFKYEMVRDESMELRLLETSDPNANITMPFENFVVDIDFRPRSSIWKTGMVLTNSEGTLDELYRGEVMAVFYHVMPNMPRYKVGDKIGQVKLGITLPLMFEFVDEINEDTERGAGGFGSTGLQ